MKRTANVIANGDNITPNRARLKALSHSWEQGKSIHVTILRTPEVPATVIGKKNKPETYRLKMKK